LDKKRILVFSPHTDDGEFGCGASIARFIKEGTDVYYAAFTLAEESVPSPFPKNILEIEVKDATKELVITFLSLYLVFSIYAINFYALFGVFYSPSTIPLFGVVLGLFYALKKKWENTLR